MRTIGMGIAILLAAASGLGVTTEEPRVEFAEELQQLERRAKEGRWNGVKKDLDELLVEHREETYVAARVFDLLELYEGAAFQKALPGGRPPEPASVVSGELVR